MPEVHDQLGRILHYKSEPKRIVSIVPSQTELLHDLGLEQEVVGITKFCIHPGHWTKSKVTVGGTKKLNLELIASLNPDLIIGNKEENEESQILFLAEQYPVWMSDIQTFEDALEMIETIGFMSGRRRNAVAISDSIRSSFDRLQSEVRTRNRSIRVAYFIWKDPWMVAGNGTFIHEMLTKCGLQNVFGHLNRYPQIDPTTLPACGVDKLLLSSEPYPFTVQNSSFLKEVAPNAEQHYVNGEAFSWYGSRLLKSPEYFRSLLAQMDSGL